MQLTLDTVNAERQYPTHNTAQRTLRWGRAAHTHTARRPPPSAYHAARTRPGHAPAQCWGAPAAWPRPGDPGPAPRPGCRQRGAGRQHTSSRRLVVIITPCAGMFPRAHATLTHAAAAPHRPAAPRRPPRRALTTAGPTRRPMAAAAAAAPLSLLSECRRRASPEPRLAPPTLIKQHKTF